MRRTALAWFSGILVLLGILGFIPGITTSSNHLFGLFQVNGWFNALYIAIGLVGLLSLVASEASSAYFKTVSVIFALWAIIGLFVGTGGQVLGFISNNYWDVALNAVLAIAAAGYGWSMAMAPGRESVAFGEYQSDSHDKRR